MELCSGMWLQAALEESVYSSSTCIFFFRSFAGRPWFPLHCSAYTGVLTPENDEKCMSVPVFFSEAANLFVNDSRNTWKHLETCWNMSNHADFRFLSPELARSSLVKIQVAHRRRKGTKPLRGLWTPDGEVLVNGTTAIKIQKNRCSKEIQEGRWKP